MPTATAFMRDLPARLANRVQLSPDAMKGYIDAAEIAFRGQVDYGQIVKFYEAEPLGPGRYSPPKVVGVQKMVVSGDPEMATISTSIVERQNLSMRMCLRRLTRLTNGYSKRVENLRAAITLYFAFYSFVRQHQTLRCSPAMAAGIEDKLWSMGDPLDAVMAN